MIPEVQTSQEAAPAAESGSRPDFPGDLRLESHYACLKDAMADAAARRVLPPRAVP